MSELIPPTPENEEGERLFWDGFIRSLDALSDMEDRAPNEHDLIDMMAILDGMEHETEGDALELLFNYATQVTVPSGQSSELKDVFAFLVEEGFLEGEEESPEDYA